MWLIKNKTTETKKDENKYYKFTDDRIICSCPTINDKNVVYAHYKKYLDSLHLGACSDVDKAVFSDSRFYIACKDLGSDYISINCGADILHAEHFFGLKLSTKDAVNYYKILFEASHKNIRFNLSDYLSVLPEVITQIANEHGILILSDKEDREKIYATK